MPSPKRHRLGFARQKTWRSTVLLLLVLVPGLLADGVLRGFGSPPTPLKTMSVRLSPSSADAKSPAAPPHHTRVPRRLNASHRPVPAAAASRPVLAAPPRVAATPRRVAVAPQRIAVAPRPHSSAPPAPPAQSGTGSAAPAVNNAAAGGGEPSAAA